MLGIVDVVPGFQCDFQDPAAYDLALFMHLMLGQEPSCGVQGLGLRVGGLGFEVWDLGFRRGSQRHLIGTRTFKVSGLGGVGFGFMETPVSP